jgi:predicted flap endonuclease-1-like 5' DNA nuclease
MARLIDIESVGPEYASRLERAGVNSIDSLLGTAGPASGRAKLAAQLGVSDARVLEWVNRADLMRINGVGSEYADLLENAGVDSCTELATRNAANLHARLLEVNADKHLVRQEPNLAMVTRWIADAAGFPKVVTH